MKEKILLIFVLIAISIGFSFGLKYFLDIYSRNSPTMAQEVMVATSVLETLSANKAQPVEHKLIPTATIKLKPTETREPPIYDSGCCGYPFCPNEKPKIGMTTEEVRILCNFPQDINRTTTSYGISEQWVYTRYSHSGEMYLYFEDGILSAIQD